MQKKEYNINNITCFIKKNIIIVIAMIMFAIIEKMVPLASGDDWTFCTWYKGLSDAPKVLTWLWNHFNGRPTLYYTFSAFNYYFGIWFLITPLSVCLYYIALKKLFRIDGILSQLFILVFFLMFSWNICRNIYLWPTGNSAYVFPWAIMIILFACVSEKSDDNRKFLLLLLSVFLIGLGNENASLACFVMYFVYWVIEWKRKGVCDFKLMGIMISAGVSAGLCILNPSGQRYAAAMSKIKVSLPVMIHDNFNVIARYLIEENGIIFIPLTIIVIFITIKKKLFSNNLIKLYMAFIGLCGGIICVNLFLKYFEVSSASAFAGIIFANNILVDFVWYLYIIALLLSVFLIVESEEIKSKWIALFSFAVVSSGVFVVLPEISQRSMFYALSVVIFYTAYLINNHLAISSKGYQNILFVLMILLIVKFDSFMYVLVPAREVTLQREAIVDEYHRLAGLGQADDIHTIYFPRYADDSINWDDANMNPKQGKNNYAYFAMKDYYGIPDEVDVILCDE